MQSVRPLLFVVLLVLTGCVKKPPATDAGSLDDELCSSTAEGHSCVTLRISANDEVRDHSNRPLRGPLNWALYRGGDVDLLGPGDHKSLYGDTIQNVNLEQPNSDYAITIADVTPQKMQSLAYLDTDNDGDSSSGDPVTFPSGPFDVPPNSHIVVKVVLDFLR